MASAPIRHDLRRNFFWAALSGALFECGAAFADTRTVVPAFLSRVTPSSFAVGAAESLARFGWLLPQLFAANYAQGLRHRKPIYLVAGWGRAVCLGLLAAPLILWGAGNGAATVLALFFALWTGFSFISGLAGVPYNDIVGRTIPSDRRSRLLAVRVLVGGALAVGAGLLIRVILKRGQEESLGSYGMIFGVGATVLAVSTLCFAAMREPPAPIRRERPDLGAFLREGWYVLQADARFRLFVHAQWVAGLTTMAFPFYVLQARRLSGVGEAEVGTLLAAQMFGALALNPLWGWWGDRQGKLSLLKLLAVTGLISPLLAMALPWLSRLPPVLMLSGYAVAFFFVGAASSGRVVGDLGYLMEISPDDRRPEYSGYMNALVAPSRLLPMVAGLLVEAVSFQVLFALAALAVLARLGLLAKLERTAAMAELRHSR
ncbi:MAG: MFS transporter [Candidatus Methylomirabilia bacterium]